MAILHGKNLQILKRTTDTTYAAVVAMAKSCDVYIEADSLEKSSSTSGTWREYDVGLKGWSINVSHLVTVGSFPTEAEMVGTIITIRVTDGTAQMQGSALVKTWKATGTMGNLTQGSFQLLGSGPLSRVTT